MSRLKKRYLEFVREELHKKFGYSNPMLIPALKKVAINMGIAKAAKDKKAIDESISELTLISGQKAVATRARKAIANFKLREGQIIGVKATLRGTRMYDFIDRLANVVLPRVRDFRGLGTKGDGRGNYTLGLEDQQVFPELNLDLVTHAQGMHITFVTSAVRDEECIELLRLLGLPFKELPICVAS